MEASIQQPEGDDSPDDTATAAPLAINAVGSVVTVNGMLELVAHGEGMAGVGTMICGLWPDPPASVAVGGIVASM